MVAGALWGKSLSKQNYYEKIKSIMKLKLKMLSLHKNVLLAYCFFLFSAVVPKI